MNKIYKLAIVLLSISIITASCGGGAQDEELPEIGTVTFGYLPLLGYAPVYIGFEKGYFEEEGIQLELISFKSGSFMMPLLATGDLDIGGGQPGTELFNAVHQGLPIKMVGAISKQTEGHDTVPILVRKDLYDTGQITQPADLKGATVAMNVERGLVEIITVSMLAMGGLTLDDVELVIMPFPEMIVALANQAIDVALVPEPLGGVAVRDEYAVVLMQTAEIFDDPFMGILYFGERLLEPENREVGIRFFKAYLKAVRELSTEDGYTEENVAIISKYTNVPAPAIKNGVKNYFEPNGDVNTSFVEESMLYFIEQGYTELSEPMDMSLIFDPSFVEAAVDRIGLYEE